MEKLKIGAIVFTVFLSLFLVVNVTYALQSDIYPSSNIDLPGHNASTPALFITDVINKILLPIAGTIAVLFIIIGGFQYITSGGNEELAEAGKKNLQNAIIGLVIVILSYVIIRVIIYSLNI